MKSRFLPYLLLVFITAMVSCDEHGVTYDPTGDRYFPLQVGNYWYLEPSDPYGMTVEATVTDKVFIHGKEYFKIHKSIDYAEDPDVEVDNYFRTAENGFTYLLTDSAANVEMNVLRLGAPDGTKWQTASGQNVSVRAEQLEINGHTFTDCKTFYYYYQPGGDDGNSSSYASGIGYVKIYAGWISEAKLAFARIDGVEYHFEN